MLAITKTDYILPSGVLGRHHKFKDHFAVGPRTGKVVCVIFELHALVASMEEHLQHYSQQLHTSLKDIQKWIRENDQNQAMGEQMISLSNVPTGAPKELLRYHNLLLDLFKDNPNPKGKVGEIIDQYGICHLRKAYRDVCETNGIPPVHPTPTLDKKKMRTAASSAAASSNLDLGVAAASSELTPPCGVATAAAAAFEVNCDKDMMPPGNPGSEATAPAVSQMSQAEINDMMPPNRDHVQSVSVASSTEAGSNCGDMMDDFVFGQHVAQFPQSLPASNPYWMMTTNWSLSLL